MGLIWGVLAGIGRVWQCLVGDFWVCFAKFASAGWGGLAGFGVWSGIRDAMEPRGQKDVGSAVVIYGTGGVARGDRVKCWTEFESVSFAGD